ALPISKNIPIYEKLSYPLMILAFFSIVHDWNTALYGYDPEPQKTIMPLININFLTSLLFIAAFGLINFLDHNKNYPSAWVSQKWISKIISFFIPAVLLFTLYYAFRIEIANYWNQLYSDSALIINSDGHEYPNYYWNYDLKGFKTIWIINYSLLFVSVLSFINIRKLRNRQLGLINLGLIFLTLTVFLVQGLYVLSELRESYLEQTLSQFYERDAVHIGIRYVSFAFVALALFACYKYIREDFI